MSDIRIEPITADSLLGVAAVQHAAFDSAGGFQENIEPSPRASQEIRDQRLASRLSHKLVSEEGGKEAPYVAYRAVTPDGQTVGISYWRKPGLRHKTLDPTQFSEEDKENYHGWRIERYESLMATSQECQDEVLKEYGEEEGLWYLEVLAVHPDHQKKRIGPRLLDHHLNTIELPCWLESSPAGFPLYVSRKFQKVRTMRPDGWDHVFKEGGLPGMYRPRQKKDSRREKVLETE